MLTTHNGYSDLHKKLMYSTLSYDTLLSILVIQYEIRNYVTTEIGRMQRQAVRACFKELFYHLSAETKKTISVSNTVNKNVLFLDT